MTGTPNWGVPDWLDVGGYPCAEIERPGRFWAWEFLRRNHEYRKFYDAKVRNWRAETGNENEAVFKETERFGLLGLPPDPASSGAAFFRSKSITTIKGHRPTLEQRPSDLYLKFDLTLPLRPQFTDALRRAEGLQEHRREKGMIAVAKSRKRQDKYVAYLQMIDARDASVPLPTIGKALFPADSESVLKKKWSAARRLRDGDFLLLASLD
jgi:hypothetical protein